MKYLTEMIWPIRLNKFGLWCRHMRKPIIRGFVIACIIAVVSVILGYVGLAQYYKNTFSANTWINGVYCTGYSVQEISSALSEQTEVPEFFTVVGYDRTGEVCEEVTWTISMDELSFVIDYESALDDYIMNQNAWMWFDNLSVKQKHSLEPHVTYDEYVLRDFVKQMTAQAQTEEEYYIEYSEEEGYVLHDGLHNRVDEQKVLEVIRNALGNRVESVNLVEEGCYFDLEMNAEQVESRELWLHIDAFQKNGPYYDFGDGPKRIEPYYMADFLDKHSTTYMPFITSEGHFCMAVDSAKDWIAEMAEQLDTYKKVWEFESTRGETLSIEGKTYGTVIDQERESVWLEDYLSKLVQGMSATGTNEVGSEQNPRVPEYSREAYNRSSELGSTYIEVDMGSQKLYYYEKGKLLVETDVVTGNMRRRWDTPEGVNYVYNKQKNRILRGQNYATPVDFWMPVNGAIGIHDADWRDEFGGEIYKTDGSHGCVNVPKEVMPKLYELVEIGTPVVMFYGSDPYEVQETVDNN